MNSYVVGGWVVTALTLAVYSWRLLRRARLLTTAHSDLAPTARPDRAPTAQPDPAPATQPDPAPATQSGAGTAVPIPAGEPRADVWR